MYSIAKANKLLPTIIEKNKHFEKQIRNKIRVSSIFQEIDQKASKELMNLVYLSEKRNRYIKTGSLLQTVVQKSSEKLNMLSSKIINDPIYGDNGFLKEEKKKLRKGIAKQYEEEFGKLVKQMENVNKVEYSFQGKTHRTKSEQSHIDTFNKMSPEEKAKRTNTIINEKIINEQKEMNNNIDEYLTKLNKLYHKYIKDKEKCNDEEEKEEIKQKYTRDKKKLKGLTMHNKSELLYYKKYSPQKTQLIKSNSQKEMFNIKKLIPYTRLGKVKKENISNWENEINIESLIHSKQNNNYSNTADLVLKQAIKNYSLDEDLLHKAQSFNNLVDQQLPSLDEYNKIVKNKLTAMKLNKITNTSSNNKNITEDGQLIEDYIKMSTCSNINEETVENFNKIKTQRIKETIQALIDEAKKGDDVNTIEKQKQNDVPKEEKTFLSSVNIRAKNKFCDGYSVREGLCNEMIDNLVEFFGKNSYSKKQVSESVDMYLDLVNNHKKQQKEKLHKKYIHKINSEDRKVISDKIKRNLSAINLSKKEEHEIDFVRNMNKKLKSRKHNVCISSNGKDSEIRENTSVYYEEYLEQKNFMKKREKSKK